MWPLLWPLTRLLRMFRRPRPPPIYWPYPLQHCLVFGMTGSGKTTGSLPWILGAWLARAERPGGIFLASKRDDVGRYIAHATHAGRADDIVHVTVNGDYGCDPLAVYFTYPWATPISAERILSQCIAVHDESGKGGDENAFFRQWGSETRLHAITLCLAAHDTVRVKDVKRFVDSLPYGNDDKSFEGGYAYQTLRKALDRLDALPPAFYESVYAAQQFVTRVFRGMPDRQREGVRSSAVSGINGLVSYPLGRLLDLDSLHPAMLENGALLMFDLPPLVGGHAYRVLSALYRSVFETVTIARSSGGRPVLSVADEFSLHFVPDDPMRAATAREGGLFMLRIIQTKEVAQLAIGGDQSEQMVMALVEQFPLLVVHQLRVGKTAEMVGRMCGEKRVLLFNGGGSHDRYDPLADILGTHTPSVHTGFSEQIRDAVPAHVLSKLLRGGPPAFETECLIVEPGAWRFARFPQCFL